MEKITSASKNWDTRKTASTKDSTHCGLTVKKKVRRENEKRK